jgi:hypothetical protein
MTTGPNNPFYLDIIVTHWSKLITSLGFDYLSWCSDAVLQGYMPRLPNLKVLKFHRIPKNRSKLTAAGMAKAIALLQTTIEKIIFYQCPTFPTYFFRAMRKELRKLKATMTPAFTVACYKQPRMYL